MDSSNDEAILKAAEYGRVGEVRQLLLDDKFRADVGNRDGRSALHRASGCGYWSFLPLQITAHAQLGSQDNREKTPLFEASLRGDAVAVRLLILEGADVNLQSPCGKSPLQVASEGGHSGVVSLLILANAQLDHRDSRGYTALYEAASHGHADVVRMLTQAGASVDLHDFYGRTPLHLASHGGDLECAWWLLRAGANSDLYTKSGTSATHKAAQQGHTDLLRLLLAETADPNLCTKDDEETPLHLAALYGHSDGISVLVSAGADPNALNNSKFSPLHLAAMMGHEGAVLQLLKSGCDAEMTDGAAQRTESLSAAAVACCFGQISILLLLLRHSMVSCQVKTDSCYLSRFLKLPGSTEWALKTILRLLLHYRAPLTARTPKGPCADQLLSVQLHSAMKDAGFVQRRAAVQSALADVLQDIERRRCNDQNIHIVGSYADGWGNSLVSLNGVTDTDADIDQTHIVTGRVFHLRGLCRCSSADSGNTVDYENGHVTCPGSASKPADPWIGSPQRPAVDIITAYLCCTYPQIAVLQAEHQTHIQPSVLESLRQELHTSPCTCHLVAAAPPGEDGQQLRVSTSLLEKILMRSLTDVQGQVFVLIKYLVKQVLGTKVLKSLKTYHAKTLMFFLLDETPADAWQPCQIISLTRHGLQKLLHCLEDKTADTHQCMRHFFMRDAWVYLKNGHCDKLEVIMAVKEVIEQLSDLLQEFKANLRPLSDDEGFRFHPFLILPAVVLKGELQTDHQPFPYHSLSDAVRILLMRLSQEEKNAEDILGAIRRLPDSAATARHCLTVLTHMKFNQKDEAVKAVRQAMSSDVSNSVPSRDNHLDVRRHLETTDSAWKFCLYYVDKPPELEFLPLSISFFPIRIQYAEMKYMNMKALLRCLSLYLGVADETRARDWFEETLKCEEPDPQELLMTLEFCRDKDLLVNILHRHKRIICGSSDVRKKVQELLKDPHFMKLSLTRTVETALKQLQVTRVKRLQQLLSRVSHLLCAPLHHMSTRWSQKRGRTIRVPLISRRSKPIRRCRMIRREDLKEW